MSMFPNDVVIPQLDGSGVEALDCVLSDIVRQKRFFNIEEAIDASIRTLTPIRECLRNGWDAPFNRKAAGMVLDLIEQFHMVHAVLRTVTKPHFFRLVEGKIEKATRGSAAFDLFSTVDIEIGDTPVPVPTGVKTEFSPGLVAIIKEKSGLSVNKWNKVDGSTILQGLEVKAGVIDSDYRDEWKVVLRRPIQERNLFNCFTYSDEEKKFPEPFKVKAGDKIAQVLLIELPTVELFGDGIKIKDEIREGGFGSTGK